MRLTRRMCIAMVLSFPIAGWSGEGKVVEVDISGMT